MLLPRPEIRIPTRLGSCIVCRGPILVRAPGAGLAVNGAAARTIFDPTDLKRGLARAFELARDLSRALRRDHNRHSDAAIERPRHFFHGDPATLLKEREDRWQLPTCRIDHCMAIIGQNPRNILEKSAASDVRKTLDLPLLHERQQRGDVDARRFKQCFAEGYTAFAGQDSRRDPSLPAR